MFNSGARLRMDIKQLISFDKDEPFCNKHIVGHPSK